MKKLNFNQKVEIFVNLLIEGENNKRWAALQAHKQHGLNAADSAGGIGSDQAAFQQACEQVGA